MLQKAVAYFSIPALSLALAACTGSDALTTAPQASSVTNTAAESEGLSSSTAGGRPGSTGAVYVTTQGLFYDTFVVADPLPMEGRFQLIADGQTMYGPGQPGYLGGRWWEDRNGDGIQDAGDHFFLCPLLPPGRITP